MAASVSGKRLQDEVSCFLCHKYFSDPVSIECGHSFCQKCISQFWESGSSCCPQCGKRCLERNFRPNQELRKIVQIAKRMKSGNASAARETMCDFHQEPLEFFCKDDQKLLCPNCVESKDHSKHGVVPAQTAAREYKEKLEIQLQTWKENQEKNISFHAEEEKRYKEFLEKVGAEKQKIISKFKEGEEYLKQQQNKVLDQLEDIVKKGQIFVTKLSNNVYFGDTLIREMEEKGQQPPNQFLQNIETTLSRCSVLDYQEPSITSVLEEELLAFSKKYNIIQETMRHITDFVSKQLEVKWANVTLDPDTTNSELKISPDKKMVERSGNSLSLWKGDSKRLADYPQRFSSPCVVACQGFNSGRHYWEVQVKKKGQWAVGVARESINRKETVRLPKKGIWDVRTNCIGTSMTGKNDQKWDTPKAIGVYLDYEGNRVLFLDADKGKLLDSYTPAFKGEIIRPFFWLLSGSLALSELTSGSGSRGFGPDSGPPHSYINAAQYKHTPSYLAPFV